MDGICSEWISFRPDSPVRLFHGTPQVLVVASAILLGGAAASCADAATSRDASMVCETAIPLSMPPCDEGYFLYEDRRCGPVPPDAEPFPCVEEGDGLCHRECGRDADCTDPCRPYCRRLGLFSSGDFNCNRIVMICRAEDRSDCTL